MCRRRKSLLVAWLTWACFVCGCAKPYLKPPTPAETLNQGLVGFSLELAPDGSCHVLVGIKDGSTGRTDVPRQWCVDAKRAKTTLATVPKPEPPKDAPKP